MITLKLKAVIIDDEQHCIETLMEQLQRHCPQIEVVQTYTTAKDGLLGLKQNPPDLLFIDVEMPWMNGMELLTALGKVEFQVIFTTAHNQYAVQAFRLSAIDYLLKPINTTDLTEAVRRATTSASLNINEGIQNLQNNMNPSSKLHRVAIPTREGIDYILIKDIIHCEADSNYTHIYLTEKRHLIMSKPLKELELQLRTYNFCRIHHSFLINLNHMVKYIRGNAGYVIMANKQHLNVSRSKKQELMSKLGAT